MGVKITGGQKLEAYLRDKAVKVQKAGTLQVGFMEDATYPDGKQVATIAAIQEFGAPGAGIPPRPFFRNMIAKHSGEWPNQIAALLKAKDFDVNGTLESMGLEIEGQLQQSIEDTNDPPLSPVTVMLRGMRYNAGDFAGPITGAMVGQAAKRVAEGKTNYGAPTKPLVYTGDMRDAVRSVVTPVGSGPVGM